MKTGIIVGAAPLGKEREILKKMLTSSRKDYYVVAADGGICFFLEENIRPDHFIGDMDSTSDSFLKTVKSIFPDLKTNSCSPIKDETDMELGLQDAFSNGCDTAYMFGGLGGERISHAFANIQLMHHFLLEGKKITAYYENAIAYLTDKDIDFKARKAGFISILSLTDEALVSIKGLKYEFEGKLTNAHALGVSNEFIGKEVHISLDKGVLLIVEES
ncbi:MAG: thiamine diphosphokinase [Lachnospiraceae bacterium]|nr:thiamine diphosphokinase [Lachnospiraceae bacterium]